jgi:hypothetical protein
MAGPPLEKLLFVSFREKARHNRDVIGPYLNAFGILLGALFGLTLRKPLKVRTQAFFRSALGAFTVFYGLRLIYENVHGGVLNALRQVCVAGLAVVAGYWLGRLLRLQVWSNRAGHRAAVVLGEAQKQPPGSTEAGFWAVSLLFCAAPLGILGAVMDGLENFFYLLLLKAVMDGLAMMSFMKMFRWPVALAAIPVFVFLNGLALLVRMGAHPGLGNPLTDSVGLAAGLVTCVVALVIFEIRRVELANYLPALAVAPLLAHWLG